MMQELSYCKLCVISNYRPSSVVEFKSQSTDSKLIFRLPMEYVQLVYISNKRKYKLG